MKHGALFILLLALTACVRHQRSTHIDLQIENGINRGITYTKPATTSFNLRYIAVKITNNNSFPLELQLTFAKTFDYPFEGDDDTFQLIPMPTAWALDGGELTESMLDELEQYIDNPSFHKALAPGDTCLLAIGSLYPQPPKTTGVLPRRLFIQSDSSIFTDCGWLREDTSSPNPQLALGLKLVFGDSCMVIPCGYILHKNSSHEDP